MQGICAVCGPVSLKEKGGGVRCSIALRIQRDTRKPQGAMVHKYKHINGTVYISQSKREELFEASNKRCAMCSTVLTINTAQYDHCHQTGEFRGWLCKPCNQRLGWMGDSIEEIERNVEIAMKYLGSRA